MLAGSPRRAMRRLALARRGCRAVALAPPSSAGVSRQLTERLRERLRRVWNTIGSVPETNMA